MIPKKFFSISFILFCLTGVGQKYYYGEQPVQWEEKAPLFNPAEFPEYKSYDMIVLDQRTEFNFFSSKDEKLINYVRVLVNTKNGAQQLGNKRMPESFDEGYDLYIHKQGRKAKYKVPYTTDYRITQLAARKFSNKKWSPLTVAHSTEKIRRTRTSGNSAGEFQNDEVHLFNFSGIEEGDIVDLYYEADFSFNYGSNLFYFQGSYPKLKCEFVFNYIVEKRFESKAFILAVNTPSNIVKKGTKSYKDNTFLSQSIKLDNLQGINYPPNSFPARTLPYVFADFSFYRILKNSYPADGSRINETEYYRPDNFNWIIFRDTTNYFTKVYDKQSAAIRKFLTKLPALTANDSTNKDFFKAMCDTLNSFRFISSKTLYYDEPNLRDVYSGEHLLKRRLIEHQQSKIYNDILNEGKIFYYIVSVQDKRLGEHTPFFRVNYAYERNLIAMPFKGSYMYFMPRYNGLKYHLNELPFYYEGALANLRPRNFQVQDTGKSDKFFKFIKTHRGTYNDNTRTENAKVTVSLDKSVMDLTIKESLSGQFSTILRHKYLNEYIDSTVSPHYFKRCVDKPGATDIKMKLSSKITDYPFRYSFVCSNKIALTDSQQIPMKDWFTMVLNKNSIPEKPTHDFFFDFELTDSYNYLMEFSTPVELLNIETFSKSIQNDYFELQSSILKNEDGTYLLKMQYSIKKQMIPKEQASLLMELIDALESINNYQLKFRRKA